MITHFYSKIKALLITIIVLHITQNVYSNVIPSLVCEPLNKGNFSALPPVPPSVCASIIDYTVGIPSNTCQSQVDSTLSALSTLNTVLSTQCQIAVNTALCTATYPKCVTDTKIAIQPCSSLCTNVQESCSTQDKSILGLAGILPKFDCSNEAIWSQDMSKCNSGSQKVIQKEHIQAPKCVTYSGNVCKNNTPAKVYIPAGYTEEALENVMTRLQFTFAVSSQTTKCDIFQVAWNCANTFMECEEASLNGLIIPVPKLPCNSLCNAYNEACEPFFAISEGLRQMFQPQCSKNTFGQQLSCDKKTVLVPGQPSFPTIGTIFLQTSIGDVTSTCSTWSKSSKLSQSQSITHPSMKGLKSIPTNLQSSTLSSDSDSNLDSDSYSDSQLSSGLLIPYDANNYNELASAVTQINAVCPGPLVIPDDPTSKFVKRIVDGACAPSCPLNSWSLEEYQMFDKITIVGIVLSSLASFFIAISWTCFKEERKSDHYLMMNYCLNVAYVSLIITAIRTKAIDAPSMAHALCKNNAEEFHMQGYCVVQGVIFIYAVLAAASWWLVQAFDIFRLLVLEYKPEPNSKAGKILRVSYHIFAWVPPGCVVIAALIADQIGGYTAGTPWCFFSQGRGMTDTVELSQGLFYYPTFAYTALGYLLMVAVVVKIIRYSRKIENRSKSCSERYMIPVHFRIFLYVIGMGIVWFYLFFYKIYAVSQMSTWVKGTTDFYICLLFTQYTTPNTDCGIVPAERINLPAMSMLVFSTCFAGFLAFLIHATSITLYQTWLGVFYDCFKRINPRCEVKSWAQYSYKLRKSQLSSASRHTSQGSFISNDMSQQASYSGTVTSQGSRNTGSKGIFERERAASKRQSMASMGSMNSMNSINSNNTVMLKGTRENTDKRDKRDKKSQNRNVGDEDDDENNTPKTSHIANGSCPNTPNRKKTNIFRGSTVNVSSDGSISLASMRSMRSMSSFTAPHTPSKHSFGFASTASGDNNMFMTAGDHNNNDDNGTSSIQMTDFSYKKQLHKENGDNYGRDNDECNNNNEDTNALYDHTYIIEENNTTIEQSQSSPSRVLSTIVSTNQPSIFDTMDTSRYQRDDSTFTISRSNTYEMSEMSEKSMGEKSPSARNNQSIQDNQQTPRVPRPPLTGVPLKKVKPINIHINAHMTHMKHMTQSPTTSHTTLGTPVLKSTGSLFAPPNFSNPSTPVSDTSKSTKTSKSSKFNISQGDTIVTSSTSSLSINLSTNSTTNTNSVECNPSYNGTLSAAQRMKKVSSKYKNQDLAKTPQNSSQKKTFFSSDNSGSGGNTNEIKIHITGEGDVNVNVDDNVDTETSNDENNDGDYETTGSSENEINDDLDILYCETVDGNRTMIYSIKTDDEDDTQDSESDTDYDDDDDDEDEEGHEQGSIDSNQFGSFTLKPSSFELEMDKTLRKQMKLEKKLKQNGENIYDIENPSDLSSEKNKKIFMIESAPAILQPIQRDSSYTRRSSTITTSNEVDSDSFGPHSLGSHATSAFTRPPTITSLTTPIITTTATVPLTTATATTTVTATSMSPLFSPNSIATTSTPSFTSSSMNSAMEADLDKDRLSYLSGHSCHSSHSSHSSHGSHTSIESGISGSYSSYNSQHRLFDSQGSRYSFSHSATSSFNEPISSSNTATTTQHDESNIGIINEDQRLEQEEYINMFNNIQYTDNRQQSYQFMNQYQYQNNKKKNESNDDSIVHGTGIYQGSSTNLSTPLSEASIPPATSSSSISFLMNPSLSSSAMSTSSSSSYSSQYPFDVSPQLQSIVTPIATPGEITLEEEDGDKKGGEYTEEKH